MAIITSINMMMIIMSKSCISSSWSCDHDVIIDDIDDHHPEHLLELLHCFFCLLCPQLHHSLDLILVNESNSDKIKLVGLDGLRVTRLVGRNGQKHDWYFDPRETGEDLDKEKREGGSIVGLVTRVPSGELIVHLDQWTRSSQKLSFSCPKKEKGPSASSWVVWIEYMNWIHAALCNTNLLSILIFQVIWRKGLQESPVRLLRSHSWPFSLIFTLVSLAYICLYIPFTTWRTKRRVSKAAVECLDKVVIRVEVVFVSMFVLFHQVLLLVFVNSLCPNPPGVCGVGM